MASGLPFHRGSSYGGGSADLVKTTLGAQFFGEPYWYGDTVHKLFGRAVCLVVAKNLLGAVLKSLGSTTTAADRGNVVLWDVDATPADAYFRGVNSKCTTIDEVCAGIVDDAYTIDIPIDDLFWLIRYGPVDVMNGLTSSDPSTLGDTVGADDDADKGKIGKSASTAAFALAGLGRAMETTTADDGIIRIFANVKGA